jgi:hypothetical protein
LVCPWGGDSEGNSAETTFSDYNGLPKKSFGFVQYSKAFSIQPDEGFPFYTTSFRKRIELSPCLWQTLRRSKHRWAGQYPDLAEREILFQENFNKTPASAQSRWEAIT